MLNTGVTNVTNGWEDAIPLCLVYARTLVPFAIKLEGQAERWATIQRGAVYGRESQHGSGVGFQKTRGWIKSKPHGQHSCSFRSAP